MLAPLRRPAVLVSGGALVLTSAIISNALFLQPGRHPAPLWATRADLPEPEVARPDVLVEAVQAALRDAGFYSGPIDGLAGPRTEAAIADFERRGGRAPTRRASPELLDAILATSSVATLPVEAAPVKTASASPPQAAAHVVNAPALDDRVAAVQSALSRAAYGQILADGVFGPQTRDAIRRFQADHGLPVTGEINDGLIVELRAAGALDGE